jgi:hypothetical protein
MVFGRIFGRDRDDSVPARPSSSPGEALAAAGEAVGSALAAGPRSAEADQLEQLARSIDAGAGRLPTLVTSRLLQIVDVLRESAALIESQGASTEQRVLMEQLVEDHVPTPLGRYLSLPAGDRTDGSRPTALFVDQLGLVHETVLDFTNQVRLGAIEELSTHGRFLRSKFDEPALRLEGP